MADPSGPASCERADEVRLEGPGTLRGVADALPVNTRSSQPAAACAHTYNLHWFLNEGLMVQFLDYLVAGLLLSCAAALGWMIFFPA